MKTAAILACTLIVGTVTALILGGTAFAGATVTPEIDPGMATGGLTILGIGIVLSLERYRRS